MPLESRLIIVFIIFFRIDTGVRIKNPDKLYVTRKNCEYVCFRIVIKKTLPVKARP